MWNIAYLKGELKQPIFILTLDLLSPSEIKSLEMQRDLIPLGPSGVKMDLGWFKLKLNTHNKLTL